MPNIYKNKQVDAPGLKFSAEDKRSSLFRFLINDEEKQFHNFGTSSTLKKTGLPPPLLATKMSVVLS